MISNCLHMQAAIMGICLMTAAANAPETTDILLNHFLLVLMFAGAVIGGFMTLVFFPHPNEAKLTQRHQATRWMASSAFSITLTPIVVESMMFPEPAIVLATSMLLALFAWLFIELIRKTIIQKFHRLTYDK